VGDPAAIRAFFNRVGPWFYTFFFALLGYRASLRYFLRLNHQRLGLRRGMRILDAGIGTGFLAVNLLREAPVPLIITGLDFSTGMFAGLERWLQRLGLRERVRLQQGDIRKMPFRSETFDLVVSSAAMEYLPEVEEGIAECGRVLRPGGKFMMISTRRSFMGRLIALLWRNSTLDPAHIRQCMHRAGIRHIERLRFPRYFPHVNGWGMILLGRKTPRPDADPIGEAGRS